MPYMVSDSLVKREEVINAIADLAIAARAGTVLAAYQREWAWVDKQNYVDAVDADEFNEAFHAIERELDRLAQVLAQGSGLSMAPDWEQIIDLVSPTQSLALTHNLGSTNLLVDVQLGITVTEAMAEAIPSLTVGAVVWSNAGNGTTYVYLLPDEKSVMLLFPQSHTVLAPAFAAAAGGGFSLRIRLWKLGD
jgi:hypothetical protein